MISQPARRLLRGIARGCGVATSYRDWNNKLINARPEAMVPLINAVAGRMLVGSDLSVATLRKVFAGLRKARDAAGLPSVLVAWDGNFPAAWVTVAVEIAVTLTPDEGEATTHLQIVPTGETRVKLAWPEKIPFGYYTVQAGNYRSFLISAPRRASANEQKSWGAFAPAYALRAAGDQGIGGYRELAQAAAFVKAEGGAFLGTLPLLPTFYESEKPDPSPYSPVSRLFWNEIFLDLDDLPGNVKPEDDLAEIFASCRNDPVVDYAEIYRVKKRVLAKAAEAFSEADAGFQAFAASSPYLRAYAEFRAKSLPASERAAAERFHRYVQYACDLQLSKLKACAGKDCAELYLDYPVGVNPDGFDAAAFSHLFLEGFNVGAPPDMLFTKGQDWGFRPLNPRALIADRFEYFRAAIHHYFRQARMLRLDHVMGLFRIYCVPAMQGSPQGSYIYYPFDALLAILCLEAHRHDGILIGEDLGIVPAAVEQGMVVHGLHRMWILYYQMNELPSKSFAKIESDMIAGLNTHDMFPFAAFLRGEDLDELERLKLIDSAQAKKMRRSREKMLKKWNKMEKPLLTTLESLAISPARYVLVNMEDLWGETEAQNVPGTTDQYPNWRRKFAHPVEQWSTLPDVREAIAVLNAHRASHRRSAA